MVEDAEINEQENESRVQKAERTRNCSWLGILSDMFLSFFHIDHDNAGNFLFDVKLGLNRTLWFSAVDSDIPREPRFPYAAPVFLSASSACA